jgi:hypothetical protein
MAIRELHLRLGFFAYRVLVAPVVQALTLRAAHDEVSATFTVRTTCHKEPRVVWIRGIIYYVRKRETSQSWERAIHQGYEGVVSQSRNKRNII